MLETESLQNVIDVVNVIESFLLENKMVGII